MDSKRLLVVGPPGSGKLTLVKELTGSVPAIAAAETPLDGLLAADAGRPSHAGLSHTLRLENKYFTADVGVWVDEYAAAAGSDVPTLDEWIAAFAAPEARAVLDEIGCVAVTMRKGADAAAAAAAADAAVAQATAIGALLRRHAGGADDDWPGERLVVAVGSGVLDTAALDARLGDVGFELVDLGASGRGAYGELVGAARIREVLEAFAAPSEDRAGYITFGSDGEAEPAADDASEASAASDTEPGPAEPTAADVDGLERLMERMKAVKEQSEGLAFEARRAMADELVEDLLRML
ncbi:uncharacterized protein V1510DRAFT_166961 [Dipodascopsis tothii]|uniref:uncharacterized protein n=1 Tax=Dipodascopsis tothii TaxID=44089 RepID=UPI0034CF5732